MNIKKFYDHVISTNNLLKRRYCKFREIGKLVSGGGIVYLITPASTLYDTLIHVSYRFNSSCPHSAQSMGDNQESWSGVMAKI
jgi:hypothetical protein